MTFLTSITKPDPQNGNMHQKRQIISTLPVASARLSKLLILCISDILVGDLCKISFISIFLFFLVFKHDFIRCIDFIRIAASNTASDDVTNKVTHRILNTDYYILLLIL